MSLLMNVIITKLSESLSLKTKMIFSSKGEYVFLLMKSDESDIKTHALAIQANTQLEIGTADLPSLEPCDENLRRLRHVKKPEDETGNKITLLEKEIEDLFHLVDDTDIIPEQSYEKTYYNSPNIQPQTWNVYLSNLYTLLHPFSNYNLILTNIRFLGAFEERMECV